MILLCIRLCDLITSKVFWRGWEKPTWCWTQQNLGWPRPGASCGCKDSSDLRVSRPALSSAASWGRQDIIVASVEILLMLLLLSLVGQVRKPPLSGPLHVSMLLSHVKLFSATHLSSQPFISFALSSWRWTPVSAGQVSCCCRTSSKTGHPICYFSKKFCVPLTKASLKPYSTLKCTSFPVCCPLLCTLTTIPLYFWVACKTLVRQWCPGRC